VKVDGRVVDQLGVRVDPRKAKVEVDGNRLMAEPLVYIVLHKPRGVMCTLSDPEGRPTVAELLTPVGVRVVPVGRLDFHTSGALLCTNDGEFANALAHPRNKAKKVYVAKVQGLVLDHQLEDWRKSIEIDGRATAPAEVRRLRYEGDKTWLELTLREGRNRQVRRLGEATGFPVMRLARISQAGVSAEGLRPGQWRHLGADELSTLKQEFGVPRRVHGPPMPIAASPRANKPRLAAKPARPRPDAREPARPRVDAREPARPRADERRPRPDARGGKAPHARADERRPRPNARGGKAPHARADERRPRPPDARGREAPQKRAAVAQERRSPGRAAATRAPRGRGRGR